MNFTLIPGPETLVRVEFGAQIPADDRTFQVFFPLREAIKDSLTGDWVGVVCSPREWGFYLAVTARALAEAGNADALRFIIASQEEFTAWLGGIQGSIFYKSSRVRDD